jgi:hypothetical protein
VRTTLYYQYVLPVFTTNINVLTVFTSTIYYQYILPLFTTHACQTRSRSGNPSFIYVRCAPCLCIYIYSHTHIYIYMYILLHTTHVCRERSRSRASLCAAHRRLHMPSSCRRPNMATVPQPSACRHIPRVEVSAVNFFGIARFQGTHPVLKTPAK